MLVLEAISEGLTYGYALLNKLKMRTNGYFTLKEGTLYPILYRLEDDGLIRAQWSEPEGRTAPKKIYTVTETGKAARQDRYQIWVDFTDTVNSFYKKGSE